MQNEQPKAQKLTRRIVIRDTCVLLNSLMFGFSAAYFMPVSFKAYLVWSFFLSLIFMLMVFSMLRVDTSGGPSSKRRTSDSGGGGWFGGTGCGGDGCGGDGGGGD